MKDYERCQLFSVEKFDKKVTFEQPEIKLQDRFVVGDKLIASSTYKFDIERNKWTVETTGFERIDKNKPLAIITIKNNLDLLKFTHSKMKEFECFEHIGLLVVDDRSTDDIKSFCLKENIVYCRCENSLNEFNFSVLNNIGAWIAKMAGCSEIIMWNSDLWPDSSDTIPKLIELHRKEGSTISGAKLLYPEQSWKQTEEASENILTHFPKMANGYKGTIQFGGTLFTIDSAHGDIFPNHSCRFCNRNIPIANTDKTEVFVTGAFQIVNLEWFFNGGGYNCSLANQFQDVDLCYRANEEGRIVMYFGKNKHLLHDESVVQFTEKTKFSKQYLTDHVLYKKLYSFNRTLKIIGGAG